MYLSLTSAIVAEEKDESKKSPETRGVKVGFTDLADVTQLGAKRGGKGRERQSTKQREGKKQQKRKKQMKERGHRKGRVEVTNEGRGGGGHKTSNRLRKRMRSKTAYTGKDGHRYAAAPSVVPVNKRGGGGGGAVGLVL